MRRRTPAGDKKLASQGSHYGAVKRIESALPTRHTNRSGHESVHRLIDQLTQIAAARALKRLP